MQQKRILILTNRVPYPLNDGGNLAVQAMIDIYRNTGWEVYLLSMLTTRHPVPPDVLSTLYSDLYKFETVPVNNDVKAISTIANYLFSRRPNHLARFSNHTFDKKLRDILGSFKPDVVQMESVFLASYLDTIEEHHKCKTILRLHNIEYQIWERLAEEVKNPLKKLYLSNLAKRIKKFEIASWKRFDLLLPITKDDASLVRFLYHQANIAVAPFGIDTANIKRRENERWVGYHIGAMDWQPNVEAIKWFIMHVWKDVRKISPQFKFYFAGRNMPAFFDNYQPEGVYCAGEVDDANEFIADKKILIVPLRSGGGIRVKIMEAMAAGKLVISTGTGIQGIEAVNGVHYYMANSSRQFAEMIQKALSDREASEQVCSNAIALIYEKYRNEAVAAAVTKAVNDIL